MICAELLGAARAAGGEQLEIAGDERLALLEVAAVGREREQLAVGVGVDVARGVDEVRDVGPPHPVAVGDLAPSRRTARPGVSTHDLADPVDRQLALGAAPGVDEVLEAVHRHLAEDGGDRAVDPLGEQAEPARRRSAASSIRPNTSASPNTEAVSASVSGVDW